MTILLYENCSVVMLNPSATTISFTMFLVTDLKLATSYGVYQTSLTCCSVMYFSARSRLSLLSSSKQTLLFLLLDEDDNDEVDIVEEKEMFAVGVIRVNGGSSSSSYADDDDALLQHFCGTLVTVKVELVESPPTDFESEQQYVGIIMVGMRVVF